MLQVIGPFIACLFLLYVSYKLARHKAYSLSAKGGHQRSITGLTGVLGQMTLKLDQSTSFYARGLIVSRTHGLCWRLNEIVCLSCLNCQQKVFHVNLPRGAKLLSVGLHQKTFQGKYSPKDSASPKAPYLQEIQSLSAQSNTSRISNLVVIWKPF